MLALLMVVLSLMTGIATVQAHNFSDVSSTKYDAYRDAINYCYDNDIARGVTTTRFNPEQTVNRAMFITFLYRLAGKPQEFANIKFEDVPPNSYYADAVRWGVHENIVKGVTATRFAPGKTLEKQMVVTFLYRFADYTRNYSVALETNWTCNDYNDIFNYAKKPMQWAVENGILDAEKYQEPTKKVPRKDAVRYLARFASQVDGIIKREDEFWFSSEPSSFACKNRHGISASHYNRLKSVVNTRNEWDRIEAYQRSIPEGMCYGMAMCTILDKLGKIDLNGNFAKNAENMYNIQKPASMAGAPLVNEKTGGRITAIESIINYYHISQYAGYSIAPTWFGGASTTIEEGMEHESLGDMIEGQKDGGLGLFSFCVKKNNNIIGPHAVVVYGKGGNLTRLSGYNKQFYKYKVCDNLKTQCANYVYVSDDYTTCVISFTNGDLLKATAACYFNDFNAFDVIDIDGKNNSDVTASTVSDQTILREKEQEKEQEGLEKAATIYVNMSNDFTITNAEGKTLICEDGHISGTMVGKLVHMINGGPDKSEFVFAVRDSDSFIYESPLKNAGIRYISPYGETAQTIEATGVDQLEFGKVGVEMDGQDMEYCVREKVNSSVGEYMVIEGNGETQVTITETIVESNDNSVDIYTKSADAIVQVYDNSIEETVFNEKTVPGQLLKLSLAE